MPTAYGLLFQTFPLLRLMDSSSTSTVVLGAHFLQLSWALDATIFSVCPDISWDRDILQDEFFCSLLRVCRSLVIVHILLSEDDNQSTFLERLVGIAHACFAAGSHVLLSQHQFSPLWSTPIVSFLLRQMSADLVHWDPQAFEGHFPGFAILAFSFRGMEDMASEVSERPPNGHVDRLQTSFFPILSSNFVLGIAKRCLSLFPHRQSAPRELCMKSLKQQFEPPFANQDGAEIFSIPDWSCPPSGARDVLYDLRQMLRQWIFQRKIPQRLGEHASQHCPDHLFTEAEIVGPRQLFQEWVQSQGSTQVVNWEIPSHQPYALHALTFLEQVCGRQR